jgi:hypothetical protein
MAALTRLPLFTQGRMTTNPNQQRDWDYPGTILFI